MIPSMIYQFRFDKDHFDEVLRRVRRKDSLLSQGWGGGEEGGFNLEHLENDDGFRAKFRSHPDYETNRVPNSLLRIKNFCDGDVLVVPHLPKKGKVSVHIVDGNFPGCYDYLESDPTHLNHRVRIKKSYGLDGEIDNHNVRLASWSSKLRARRLPILPLDEGAGAVFFEIMRQLDADPSYSLPLSKLDEYLNERTQCLLKVLGSALENISPSGSRISFEGVCEFILTEAGYKIDRRNHYNRKGGDVDLVCVRERSDLSPFENGRVELIVQVKKHTGTTDAEAVHQVIGMMEEYPMANGCVMSLADDFEGEARDLAEGSDIRLMDRREITTLLLRALGRRATIE